MQNSGPLYDSFVITQNKKLIIINKTKCSFIIRCITYFNNQFDNIFSILRLKRGVWQICFCHVNFGEGHLKFELDRTSIISVATETGTDYEITIDSKQWFNRCTNFYKSEPQVSIVHYTFKHSDSFENVSTCKCLMDNEFKKLDMYMQQLIRFKYMYTYKQFITALCFEIFSKNYSTWLSGTLKISCYFNAETDEISCCLRQALISIGHYDMRHELFTNNFYITICPGSVRLRLI